MRRTTIALLATTLALGLAACSQPQAPADPTTVETAAFPAGWKVVANPSTVILTPNTLAINVQLCIVDASNNPLMVSPGTEARLSADPTSLPTNVTAGSLTIPAGSSCGSMTFTTGASATSGTANIRIFTQEVIPINPVPVVLSTQNNLLPVNLVGQGTIQININGLPANHALRKPIQLSGPFGTSVMIDRTTTLPNMLFGNYTLAAAASTQRAYRPSGDIVSTIIMNPSPATAQNFTLASAGPVVRSVTYQRRQGSGHLWFSPTNGSLPDTIEAFSNNQLATAPFNSGPVPSILLYQPSGLTPDFNSNISGLAVDKDGSMWMGLPFGGGPRVQGGMGKFPPSALDSSLFVANATPFVNLVGNIAGDAPADITFDEAGNLWIANPGLGIIQRVPANPTGATTPDLLIINGAPMGLALDHRGTLWMSDRLSNRLYRIRHADTFAGGIYNLQTHGFEFVSTVGMTRPGGLAVDRQNNLWFSEGAVLGLLNRITQIPAAAIPATGSAPTLNPVSYKRIIGGSTGLFTAAGSIGSNRIALAFDESGNLWTSNINFVGFDSVQRFTVAGLANGDNDVVPSQRLLTDLVTFGDVTFNPPPCGLPMYGSNVGC